MWVVVLLFFSPVRAVTSKFSYPRTKVKGRKEASRISLHLHFMLCFHFLICSRATGLSSFLLSLSCFINHRTSAQSAWNLPHLLLTTGTFSCFKFWSICHFFPPITNSQRRFLSLSPLLSGLLICLLVFCVVQWCTLTTIITWRHFKFILIWTIQMAGFPCGSLDKESACKQETPVQSLGWEDPLEKGIATHFSILAWRIPLTEEPGGL